MSRKRLRILILLCLLSFSADSFATHIFGGDLLYTHISDSTYVVTLTIYGDCSAPSDIFKSLFNASATVAVNDGISTQMEITLHVSEPGTEVSPICSAQINNTKCNGGTLPGVRRFRYVDTVVMPYRSANWSFVFNGRLTSYTAGISTSVTNIVQSGNIPQMYLKAELNNANGDNSSPVYSSIPTPFYCVKVPQQYNQGAIDADGDSLSFSLVTAIDGTDGSNINYIYPFTGANPLSVDPGVYDFNALNGQITFTPSITQDALVVCKVNEYRNGVLVGSSERELTIVVLDNCQGTPPRTQVTVNTGGSIASGSSAGANVVNVCVNTPNVSFDISLNNPDGDNTQLSASALPNGSSLAITNNNTANPSAVFSWSTGSVPIGVYTFYLNLQNDHCPLSTRSTIAYTVNVTSFPEITYKQLSATRCVNRAAFEFDTKYGYTPRTITVKKDNTTVVSSVVDTTGTANDSLLSGNYTVYVSSNPQCISSIPLIVNDSGKIPLLPLMKDYCIKSTPIPIDVSPLNTLAVITWYSANGDKLFYPPLTQTDTQGVARYYYTEQFAQCFSDRIPVTTVIHALPSPVFLPISRPETICLGDTIKLMASGGVTYEWSPKDKVFSDSGVFYTSVMEPELIQVKATDSVGCVDSSSYEYKDIQYCCQFSYPNAFTPNHDGKNDGFRILSYGNLVRYDLTVYNRWGQQVFQTNDSRKYWDGTFNGVPCDLGTYSYFFKARCLTGHEEMTKGDVTLIR